MKNWNFKNSVSYPFSSLNPFVKEKKGRESGGIHSSGDFHLLIERERSRADRTNQVFSLVRFDASRQNGGAAEALDRLTGSLAGRTRDTDEIGWYDSRCIGALLPGTGSKGAWIYARDVQARAFGDPSPLKCLVHTYPSPRVPSNGNGKGERQLDLPVRLEDGKEEKAGADSSEEPVGNLQEVVSQKLPFWKRSMDIAGSLAALVLFFPLMIFVSALIKIVSPGPIFFRQERVGHAGKLFRFLKFRTMHVNNDSAIHQRYLSTLIQGDQAMVKLDADRDPRIIRFGRFLRQSCIDELPQLINVLRGEMSLVGPRPCLPYEAEEYLLWHARRFDAVPGMTGLWQVSGKNKTTFKEMIRLDIAYSRRLSPWLDIRILLNTVPAILSMVREHLARKREASASSSGAMANRVS